MAPLVNKPTESGYYTVMKHDGHLRTQREIKKTRARVFSNVRSVLSLCITRLRLLLLLYDIDFTRPKLTIKHAFSMFYTLIKHAWGFDQSGRAQSSI